MIAVRTARTRPSDRVATQTDKTPVGQAKTFPAPVMGLVTNAAISASAGALVLDNFWPTRHGIEPRGGLGAICNIPTTVRSLFQHRESGKFFAANDTGIYQFTDASTGALTAAVTGQTSGKYSTYETQNSGGSFLTVVNGLDKMQLFNGTTWTQITGVSTPAITGIDTATISHVWGYSNRLFFIERNSMSAWYLGTDSIAGAATELPLGGVFRKGGSLLMGATWSSDSGSGIDDRCVFVSDAGEVAIYSGTNPGDINNWSKQGVYDVGDVLGRKAVVSIGGDLVFGTKDGLIPLSGVVSKDPAQLKSISMSANIEPDWVHDVSQSAGDWRVTKWPRGGMLIAAPINVMTKRFLVSNLDTGAWAPVTGWHVGDIEALGDGLYLGGSDGVISRAWTGGDDNGAPFVCRACLPFDHFGNMASIKVADTIRALWKVKSPIRDGVSIAVDYVPRFPPAPQASDPSVTTDGLWDVSDWDVFDWASESSGYTISGGWKGLGSSGYAFAPQVQITSQSAARVSAVLERIDMTYHGGNVGS